MKKIIAVLFSILMVTNYLIHAAISERIDNLSKAEMQSIIEFLGHDLLEGRAPGARGGDLAEYYIQSLCKFMNLAPGAGDGYLQPFKLKGFILKELMVNAAGIDLTYPEDVVGSFPREENEFQLEAGAVFVGFGIATPLWNWDDFKNVDVKNKIIIARVNDPGMFIPDIFEGKVLTLFGRWMYHVEEAARRGAAGILMIHTDESAGYDWNVVKNSWSGEEPYLEYDLNNNLKFRAWIKESSLRKILASKKIDLDKLYAMSLKRNFKPVDLGFNIKVNGKNSFRDLINNNVVAVIPGQSEKKIVISAHIDHLGMSPGKDGNDIFNGAIDNGSAVAALMLTAKILKEFQTDLYYTVVVLACNAEESGLLGSKYYVRNTPDRVNIIANINFEATPVWGKTTDFMAIGGQFSTLEDMLKTILEKEGLTYSYFSLVNQGFFYRSDQFSFARYNIPAIWISAGENDDSGEKKYTRYWKTDYHTIHDDFDPRWELEGLKQTIKMAILLIDHLNKTKEIPHWKNNLTFPME
ncbi:MAG TPA: M28 family peptidase [Candidatus Deferrimicrobium sp.]|nr:M28 family peptidase [Candidatus Deferrimicrobium sp.]